MLNGLIIYLNLVINILILIFPQINQYDIDQLRKEIDLKKDEKIIIIFQSLDNCIKCYQIPLLLIKELKEKQKYKFKVVCYLNCQRKKELIFFKEKFKWANFLKMNTIETKTKLFLKNDTEFAIISYNGKILIELNVEKLQNYDKTIRDIKRILID